MRNKKTASEETVKSSSAKKNFLRQKQDDERRNNFYQQHRSCLLAEARAAARLAVVLLETFRSRKVLVSLVRVTMDQVARGCNQVTSKQWLPTDDSLVLTDETCRAVLSDTGKTRLVLRLFREQVAALNLAYHNVKMLDPVVAFKLLREVSRQLSGGCAVGGDGESHASAWQYVLCAWEETDPEAVRIARWVPSEPVQTKGSDCAEVSVKKTFAVIK